MGMKKPTRGQVMKKPVGRGAYLDQFAESKKKKAAKEATKTEEQAVTEETIQTPAVEESEKKDDTMEPSTEVMEKKPENETEEEEFDLEAYSLRFLKPGIAEKTTQSKDDAPAMVIKPQDSAKIIIDWCTNRKQAGIIIGTNELAILITLGSYASRLSPAKIDKIAATIISGGEKIFVSQPYLNRLVNMGLVSKKPIEGTRGFGYALTEVGVLMTQTLAKLTRPEAAGEEDGE